MTRFGAAGSSALFTLLAVASSLAACVTPEDDYKAYLARIVDAQTGTTGDDASFDGGASAFSDQTYFMACISQVTNASQATEFTATATFRPTDANGNGTFDFSDSALVVGATSLTDLAGGQAYPVTGSVVTNGKVDVVFGPTVIPAAGDPLGQDILFTDSTLHFLIGPGDHLCANLSGVTTQPLPLTLDPSMNICIFFPTSTNQVFTFQQSDFHCP